MKYDILGFVFTIIALFLVIVSMFLKVLEFSPYVIKKYALIFVIALSFIYIILGILIINYDFLKKKKRNIVEKEKTEEKTMKEEDYYDELLKI